MGGTYVIKRGAIIGIGTALLVIGLSGLALLQTGVIYPPESIGPVSLTEVKPAEPAPAGAQAPQAQVPASADLRSQKAIPAQRFGGSEHRNTAQDRLEQQRSARKGSGMSDVLRHTARKADSKSSVRKAQSKASARKADSRSFVHKAQAKSSVRKAESKSHLYKAKSKSYARKAQPASGMKPVVITFRFDPVRDRELYVARVHSGDEIKMNVRRVGMADGRVYLAYTRNPDSKDGALVKVRAEHSMYRGIGYHPHERGYYVIEMKIYPGKRWNIKPRSFV
jgi:hypothetical protein